MKTKEVKINGVKVPCEDVREIKLVVENGELMRKITYYRHEPTFEVVEVLVGKDEGYEIEKKVRKAMLRY